MSQAPSYSHSWMFSNYLLIEVYSFYPLYSFALSLFATALAKLRRLVIGLLVNEMPIGVPNMIFLQSTVRPHSKETASQKAKCSLQNKQWRPRRGVEVYLYSFFTLTIDGCGWLTPHPCRFTHRKENRRALYRRRGVSQGQDGFGKSRQHPDPISGPHRIREGFVFNRLLRQYRSECRVFFFMKWRFNSTLRFHPWKVDAWFPISTCCSR